MPQTKVQAETTEQDQQAIRQSVRELCRDFPDAYWRKIDKAAEYPEEFVNVLTKSGYLAALIPEEFGGAGMGECTNGIGHLFERAGTIGKLGDKCKKPLAGHVGIAHEAGGAGLFEGFSVARLVIVGGEGEGHEDRRPGGGGDRNERSERGAAGAVASGRTQVGGVGAGEGGLS